MRLDIVLDFGYRNIIWLKCCLFLILKVMKRKRKYSISFVKYFIHAGLYKNRVYHVVILYRLFFELPENMLYCDIVMFN